MINRRVLIVDDNRELGENLAEILADAGFENDFFDDPESALATVQRGQYAAALIDIRMPKMDGVSLYRALRARDPGLPAIAITAYAADAILQRALDAGVTAILPKPIDISALLSRIAALAEGDVVLVVEDDAQLCQNIAEALAEHGFCARHAENCAQARELAAALDVCCLLVDCTLPDGNGIDLVEELSRGRAITSILFSGYALEQVDPTGRAEASSTRFLTKPVDVHDLLVWLGQKTKAARSPGV